MSDAAESTETQPAPAAPAKRKYTRRKASKVAGAKVAPLKVPDELAGLTEIECCADCKAEHCVISGINICGHPLKGGQIPPDDGKALARFERAKKALAHRRIDLTAA